MNLKFILFASFLLILSCNTNKKTNTEKQDTSKTEASEQTDAERKAYYGYDTLLIKEYVSDNGHHIRLEGSQSGDTYRIRVKSKQGNRRTFQIAEDWYLASHSSIAWDNDDYLMVAYGCGTACWGAKILSLNDNRAIDNYMAHAYADSTRNLIMYADSATENTYILKNFDTQKQIKTTYDLCNSLIPIELAFESVQVTGNNKLEVKYVAADCETRKTKHIELELLY